MLDKKNFYINGAWVAPKKPNDFKLSFPYVFANKLVNS